MRKSFLKSMLLTGLLAAALCVPTVVSANVENVNWTVTLTAAGRMDESSFNSEEINKKLSEMQPGDTAVFTVAIKNAHAQTADWYMENEVIRSLEEASAASNGAYTYVLDYVNDQTNKSRNLFNSDRVGGEAIADTADEGLHGATTGLDEWFYLDELKSNEGGHVTLTVSLEGESQGNDYQDTQARLRLRFAVELKGTSDTPPGSTTRTNIVKTGDPTQNLPYIVASGVAGMILLILAVVGTSRRKQERAQAARTKAAGRKGGRHA